MIKQFFEMCMILMLCLYAVNVGVIAFMNADGPLGDLFKGSQSMIDMQALEQIADENLSINPDIQNLTDTNSYAVTETSIDVSPEAEAAKATWGLGSVLLTGLVGYWGIIEKIFIAFPQLGDVIKWAILFLQVMGGLYIVSVVAALVRGGYNPG